jgi:hypothetical protein
MGDITFMDSFPLPMKGLSREIRPLDPEFTVTGAAAPEIGRLEGSHHRALAHPGPTPNSVQ